MEEYNGVIILIACRALLSYGRGPTAAAVTPCPKSTIIRPLYFPCRLIQRYKSSRVAFAAHNALKIWPRSVYPRNMTSRRTRFCYFVHSRVAPQRIRHVRLILLPGGHCGEELPCHAVHADKAFRYLARDTPPPPIFSAVFFLATALTPIYCVLDMLILQSDI